MHSRSKHHPLRRLFSLLLAVLWSGILLGGSAQLALCTVARPTTTTQAAPQCAMCLGEHKHGIKCCCHANKPLTGQAICRARCDDTTPPSAAAFFFAAPFVLPQFSVYSLPVFTAVPFDCAKFSAAALRGPPHIRPPRLQ